MPFECSVNFRVRFLKGNWLIIGGEFSGVADFFFHDATPILNALAIGDLLPMAGRENL